jgi:hypothetical protein
MSELAVIFKYVECSWTRYLRMHYKGKDFMFYLWGDYLIPAIKFSIVSLHSEDQGLPFGCRLNKVDEIVPIIEMYQEKAMFKGIPIMEKSADVYDEQNDYTLTVYSKIIVC